MAAAALAVGGFYLGAASQRTGVASVSDLEEGLAVALDVSSADVRNDPGYSTVEVDGCRAGTCRQVVVGPVPGPGVVMQERLYDAGWVLHSHDQPECVSDRPQVTGFVCSYEKDEVTVSIQVESPETPDELRVWASTG